MLQLKEGNILLKECRTERDDLLKEYRIAHSARSENLPR